MNSQESTQTNEELEQKLTELNRQIERDPENERLHFELGIAHYSKGNYQVALSNFDRCLEINNFNANTYFNRGLCLKQLKRDVDAFKAFTKCIELNPKMAKAYSERASVRSREEEKWVIEDLSKAIEIEPNTMAFYYERASARVYHLDIHGALEDFRHILALRGYDTDLHNCIIEMMTHASEPDEILRELNVASKNQPNCADLHFKRAGALVGIAAFDEANESYEKAIECETALSKKNMYMMRKGCLDYQRGLFDQAIVEFSRVLENHESHRDGSSRRFEVNYYTNALFSRAQSYMRVSEYAKALQDFNELMNAEELPNTLKFQLSAHCINGQPSRLKVLQYRSQVFENMGRVEEAIEDLTSAISISAEDPKVYEEYARLAQRMGWTEKANDAMAKHAALNKLAILKEKLKKVWVERFIGEHENNCNVEEIRDLNEKVVRACDDVITLFPNDSTVLITRSRACQSLGRYSDAISDSKIVLAIEPENKEANTICAESYYDLGNYELAIEYSDKTAVHEPSLSSLNKIRCLAKLHRLDEAADLWEQRRPVVDEEKDSLSCIAPDYYAAGILLYYNKAMYSRSIELLNELRGLSIDPAYYCDSSGAIGATEDLIYSKDIDAQKSSALVDIAEAVSPVFWVETMSIWFDSDENYVSLLKTYAQELTECCKTKKCSDKLKYLHRDIFSSPGDIDIKPFWNTLCECDSNTVYLTANVEILDCFMNRHLREKTDPDGDSCQAGRIAIIYRLLNRALRQRLSHKIAANERDKAEMRVEHERDIAEARVEERNKVIQDMSHSIKNLVASVVEPLNELSAKYTDDRVVIQKALRGAELIRGTVNALNLSFKGCPEDFASDAKTAATSDHAVSMEHLLLLSLESAVSNMFDGKYFADFCHAYFPTREAFFEAKNAFESAQKSSDMAGFGNFLKKNLLEFEISDSVGLKSILLDDQRNSPLKLTILLQELLLNAVKYASFVPRDGRFLRLEAKKEGESMLLVIENAFVPGKSARTTRVGNEIIKNIAHLMGGSVNSRQVNSVYETSLLCPFFWSMDRTEKSSAD